VRVRHRLLTLPIGASCTCSLALLLACEGSTGAADVIAPSGADVDQSGFPRDILARPDLQRLVDAGLDRQTGQLMEALDHPDPAARATAAQALASVQDPAATPRLVALLGDEDAAVRRNAAFALGQTAGAANASQLINALRNEVDPLVRLTLLEAAGKSGNAADLEHVVELGRDPTADDGPGLSLALYHFARRGVTDPGASATLLALLNASPESTRMRAALALAAPRNLARWDVTPDEVRRALDAMPVDRREAAPLLRILASLGDTSDLPRLHRWGADSAHWTVRTAAATLLGGHTSAGVPGTVIEALLTALDDRSQHVARIAAEALPALKARADRSTEMLPGLDPGVWAEWIRTHPERPAVAAALLPGLAGTAHESLVMEWATGRGEPGAPRALAWPALVRIATPMADSILTAGLDGARRDAYVAATLLAQRLEDLPADASLHSSLVPLVARRLGAWGPYAPASDVRGALRLVQALTEAAPAQSRELIATAARHPHAEIRAAATRAGAPAVSLPAAPRRSVNWPLLESAGPRPCLVFTTARGEFIVELYPEAAPLAVSALIEWAVAGMYDDLTFHRVEPDFILQSGDFDNVHGYGGPERGLRSEFSQLRFAPGVLGIASAGKDTEGSQFFITHNYAPSLDGRYGAIGRIMAGQDVADEATVGDPLLAVSPFERDADTAPDETSMRCTAENT
jgi:cyclophilin family peptidyl-prolyl cis-trans isomerase/HEAT repeat protein